MKKLCALIAIYVVIHGNGGDSYREYSGMTEQAIDAVLQTESKTDYDYVGADEYNTLVSSATAPRHGGN